MPVKEMTGKSDLKAIFDNATGHGVTTRGVVGTPEAPLYVKDETPPELTPEELTETRILRGLLLRWIDPPRLSEKSKPDQDKAMLYRKVNAQTLPELRRFFEFDLPEDVVYSLRQRYKDISP